MRRKLFIEYIAVTSVCVTCCFLQSLLSNPKVSFKGAVPRAYNVSRGREAWTKSHGTVRDLYSIQSTQSNDGIAHSERPPPAEIASILDRLRCVDHSCIRRMVVISCDGMPFHFLCSVRAICTCTTASGAEYSIDTRERAVAINASSAFLSLTTWAIVGMIIYGVLRLVIVYKYRKMYADRIRVSTEQGICWKCGYPVGLSDVCAECGADLYIKY